MDSGRAGDDAVAAQLASLSVAELKGVLGEHGWASDGEVEKGELVQIACEAIVAASAPAAGATGRVAPAEAAETGPGERLWSACACLLYTSPSPRDRG